MGLLGSSFLWKISSNFIMTITTLPITSTKMITFGLG